MSESFTFAVTGGASGGHAIPAVNIVGELRRRSPEMRAVFIGAANSIEQRLAEQHSIPFLPVQTIQLRRPILQLCNLLLPFILILGLVQALRILRRHRVRLVIGTGGYSSFPALAAARMLRVPYVINEQNALPGKVNRLLAKRAARIYVGYEQAVRYFNAPPGAVKVMGNPVNFPAAFADKASARAKLGLEVHRSTLFITGGSGGSRHLNRAVSEIVDGLLKEGWNVVWQVGRLPAAWSTQVEVEPNWKEQLIRVRFFDQQTMAAAMAAADLAIARCGAMTLAELALAGLPAILVPFPFAAEGHQEANARAVESAGGGVVILDRDLTGEVLKRTIAELNTNATLERMGAAMRSLARPEAVAEIAGDILTVLK